MDSTIPKLKDVIVHCKLNEDKYMEYNLDNKARWTNLGWLKALQFVQLNYITRRK